MKNGFEVSKDDAVDSVRVSISVVSHGHAGLVATLLGDIAAHVLTRIEVLLTLNLPETLPFDPAHFSFPVRIVENSAPRGFAANHNAAFRLGRGGAFCVLNPDVRIEQDPFPELLKCFQDRTVGAAAPLIRNPAGAIEDSARHFPSPSSILRKLLLGVAEIEYPIGSELIYPDWVGGMFMLFPCEIFAQIGGFDERYFLYYEDADICERLALAGRTTVLCPTVSVVHHARRQSRRSLTYLRWHMASMMRFFLRHSAIRGRRSTNAQARSKF